MNNATTNLSAQTVKECESLGVKVSFRDSLGMRLGSLRLYGTPLYMLALLQYSYGLRITEVLSITSNDLIGSNILRIKGLKGSNDRLIVISGELLWLWKFKGLNVQVFRDFNRFYVYRCYKSSGISFKSSKSKRTAVTHAFRHALVNELREAKEDMANTQRLIGQKSIKSTELYGNRAKSK